MNLYKKIYRIIGIFILILGLLLTPFLPNLISGVYPKDINLYILYLLYLFNTVITYFLFAYKRAILTADQRNDIISNINSIISILLFIIQIVVLCLFKNYYIYVIVIGLSNIVNNILVSRIVNKKYPEYVCKGNLDDDSKKDIKKRVYGVMIQKICSTTRNSLDSIFLSSFLGLNIVAIYNNYYMIMTGVTSILAILTASMVASIGNSIVTNGVEKNYKDMEKFNFIYMWISGFCTVCLLSLYQPFMKLWMGKDYLFPLSTVICFCVYFYILKMGDILSSYYQAIGLWFEGKYRAIVETILNIILNYFLGKYYGVNGIILATLISLFLVNFLYGSTIIFKYYFKSISVFSFFKRQLLYLIVNALACFVTYNCCEMINLNGILELLVKSLICLFIPNIIYLIAYYKYDQFNEMKKFTKKLF